MHVFYDLIGHGQLQHRRSLPLGEMRHEDAASIWKFDRVMMTVRNIRIYRAELPDPKVGGFLPDPSVVVFHIVGECEFGPRKHADRDTGFAF